MQTGLYFEFYVKDGKLKYRLKLSMYFFQLLSWLCIVLIVKVILASFQLLINGFLESFGNFVLYPVKSSPKFKLVTVMILIPIVMNSMQFWIQDNFLKLNKEIYPQMILQKNKQLEYELGVNKSVEMNNMHMPNVKSSNDSNGLKFEVDQLNPSHTSKKNKDSSNKNIGEGGVNSGTNSLDMV